MFLASLSKIRCLYLCGFMSGSSNPRISTPAFVSLLSSFYSNGSADALKSAVATPPATYFLLRIALAILKTFQFHRNVKIFFFCEECF